MINGVLAIALVICGMNIWGAWHANTQVIPEKGSAVNNKEVVSIAKISDNKLFDAAAYPEVVDKNLFSPDRASAPLESETADPEIKADVRISGEKVVLYGVILIDDYKKALINNPGDRKAGSKIQWVSEGDQLGNLQVEKIQEDEILLVDGSDSYRVLLYDPEKAARTSVKRAAKPAEAAQPQVIVAGRKPTAAKQKTGKQKTDKQRIDKQNRQAEKISPASDNEYEIIDTPFGQIKRKRK